MKVGQSGKRGGTWAICLSLAALLVASLSVLAPAGAAPAYGERSETYIVPTRHGKIYVEVVRPTVNGKDVKAPSVLTMSPYSVLGRNGDSERYTSRGIARVWADVVGTGNSGGCYDYGGKREKETGYDVIEWLAKRKWSTGKVGMIGGSYNGTTQYAAAVERPPHLTTIVPEAAISRWYEYAYSGGVRYFLNNERPYDEGVDTPLAFDFGLALPPPLDPQDPAWADRVASTITPCEEIEHTEHGYDDTPDYGKFWLERDYVKDAGKIRIPVLISHNWGDWNVKQEEAFNMFKAIKNSPKKALFMGNRYSGHGTPDGAYDRTVDAWFDHYLLGKDNGIQKLAAVTSQTADIDGPAGWHKGAFPNTRGVKLYAQQTPITSPNDYEWKLLPTKPGASMGIMPTRDAQFPSTNINTEAHANHHARNNHDWFWFESPKLARDTRIFGEVKVKLWSTIHRKWITFTPTIVDVDHGCHRSVAGQHVGEPNCLTDPAPARRLHSVTRGWLDTRYRKGLGKQVNVKPGLAFGTTVVEKPQDYVFKKGHSIGLNIQTEILEWSLPKAYPGCDSLSEACAFVKVNWREGKTQIVLPVVNGPKDAMQLFSAGGHQHHH